MNTKPTTMTTVRRICAILSEILLGTEDVQPTSRLTEDLCLDDQDLVELALAIEQEFEIMVEGQDYRSWTTCQDAARYVVGRRSQR